LAEIAGAVAVVVSVLYLAGEVAENNAQAQLANQLALYERVDGLRQTAVRDPVLLELVERGMADASTLAPAESARFGWFMTGYFDVWELAYFMHEAGQLSDARWTYWSTAMCGLLDQPGISRIVPSLRSSYSAEFLDTSVTCLLD